jgi:hypothetical protein
LLGDAESLLGDA